MRGLKFLVISMGALIVIGVTLLIYGLYNQANGPDVAPAPVKAETDSKAARASRRQNREPSKPFGDVDVPLPAGCHVAAMPPAMGRHLFLQIGPAGPPCESVIVFDLHKGVVQGTLHIKPAP
ncbi:MAG: hypothetical protein A3G18_02850 [Rhodospirillales bacterium RIFCSPLOWO2_12_FULL_58_28]|nr:MAG: hypothetical protein A3H92_00815 [Rhodospirillales bacterium RIFCSPLOWO2_02_FULL_58_16]OHC77085.1 MAG: hypothetical protein A3G18_02850 [Rhodospirillales bacterium RIFCSPLOWO2_12_FULL_58_28]